MAMVAAIHLWVARKGDSSVRLILRVLNAGRFEVGLEFAGGARFSEMFASRIDAENAAARRRGELESRGWLPVGAQAATDSSTSIPSFIHVFENSSSSSPQPDQGTLKL